MTATATATADILYLRDEAADWDNFADRPVTVFGYNWATSEHAFQAAKFFGVDHPGSRENLRRIMETDSPGTAKMLGRDHDCPIRPFWDTVSPVIMTLVVHAKFKQHQSLRASLVASGTDNKIVEGNYHGDELWGAVWKKQGTLRHGGHVWASTVDEKLVGVNRLGIILMTLRQQFQMEDAAWLR